MEVRSTNFERAVRFTFQWEGGYVNNPNDPGGETKYGITKSTLNAAYILGIVAHNSVKRLTRSEAESIYFELYWQAAHCDLLKYPLCVAHFDCAVNCGRATANRILQRTLNACTDAHLKIDGIIGAKTKSAIYGLKSISGAACLYNNLRMTRYESVAAKNQRLRRFMRGWTRRVNALREYV